MKKAISAGLVSSATSVAARVNRRQLEASSTDASLELKSVGLAGSIGPGATGSRLAMRISVRACLFSRMLAPG
ncbi:MAG TPA: hypothetical protein VNN07_01910 [Candidatus Tectomicrobia bacterium]|nr:hypothetical protein [Candidatus Tectomicrobia bacterium]